MNAFDWLRNFRFQIQTSHYLRRTTPLAGHVQHVRHRVAFLFGTLAASYDRKSLSENSFGGERAIEQQQQEEEEEEKTLHGF